MRANDGAGGTLGDAGTIENRILSFDHERMISIQVARAPDDFPFRAEVSSMWTVMYFEPLPERETWLRIVGLGSTETVEAQKMKAFFERGNAYMLVQLQKRFSP